MKGFEIESKEHPELPPDTIKKIVADHLKEDPNYYEGEQMEPQEVEQENGEEGGELELTIEQLPELATAQIGQVFNLNVKAQVSEVGEGKAELKIVSVSDKAFKDKKYSDLVEETQEVPNERIDG